jgi:hypothetical protein
MLRAGLLLRSWRFHPFSPRPNQYACTASVLLDVHHTTADTPGLSRMHPDALPSTCTFYSTEAQQPVDYQDSLIWCLCRRKRSVQNLRWVLAGGTCKSLGKAWNRVVMGANALCKGTETSNVTAARNVLGYTPAVPTNSAPVCYTAAGPTAEFHYLCHTPSASVCYGVPTYRVESLKPYWSDWCRGSDNGSTCTAECTENFTPANGVPGSVCINGQWQYPQPPGCVSKCKWW